LPQDPTHSLVVAQQGTYSGKLQTCWQTVDYPDKNWPVTNNHYIPPSVTRGKSFVTSTTGQRCIFGLMLFDWRNKEAKIIFFI
jgi:hypothetical protein